MKPKFIYVLMASVMLLCLASCRHKEPASTATKVPKEALEAKKQRVIWLVL